MAVIADQGKEFVGTQFKEFTNANSILLHIIDVWAPWQNGRTERDGDVYRVAGIYGLGRTIYTPFLKKCATIYGLNTAFLLKMTFLTHNTCMCMTLVTRIYQDFCA